MIDSEGVDVDVLYLCSDLSENDLTSFEPGLPALESLYVFFDGFTSAILTPYVLLCRFLNKNNFTTIPNVVYSMTKLQELYVHVAVERIGGSLSKPTWLFSKAIG